MSSMFSSYQRFSVPSMPLRLPKADHLESRARVVTLCLLGIQVVVIVAIQGHSGALIPGFSPDSQEYLTLAAGTLTDGLRSSRTLGYPLLLRLFGSHLALLPMAQLAIHVLAVTIFYFSLRSREVSRATSIVVSSAVLWSNTSLDYTRYVLTDAV